jgi:hypothetical protein
MALGATMRRYLYATVYEYMTGYVMRARQAEISVGAATEDVAKINTP